VTDLVRDRLPAEPAPVGRACRAGRAARRPRRGAPGRLPAVLAAAALLTILVVAVLGPSATVLTLGGDTAAAPPWHLDAHPSAWLVVPLTAAALACGGVAVLVGLVDVARGWAPRTGRWVAGGTAAVLATVLVPPASTGDPLIYAAYGRLVALGADPYVLTPRALIVAGDPVGRATEGPWQQVTSVYGPLATGEQALASTLGGTSTALSVFWMQLANALGWLVAGCLLLRLARHDRAVRARVVLFWWTNPLLLWAVLTGGHNDAVAAAFLVAAVVLLGRSALLSGVALGTAGTVKLIDVLLGAGLLWAVRRQPRAALALVGGALAVAGTAYAPVLPEALAQTSRARGYLSSSSPWQFARDVVGWFTGTGGNVNSALAVLSWVSVLALVVLIARQVPASLPAPLRHLPVAAPAGRRGRPAGRLTGRLSSRVPSRVPGRLPGRLLARVSDPGRGGRATGPDRIAEAARASFVVGLAWLLGGYYTLPWYDMSAWIPLCLLAASGLDAVLLTRTTVICLAYVATRSLPPGARLPSALASVQLHVEHDLSPAVHLLLITALVVRRTRPGRWSALAARFPTLALLGARADHERAGRSTAGGASTPTSARSLP